VGFGVWSGLNEELPRELFEEGGVRFKLPVETKYIPSVLGHRQASVGVG
jgi:hypothetical protein